MQRMAHKISRPLFLLLTVVSLFGAIILSCSKPAPAPKDASSRPSDVNVQVHDGGPIIVTTKSSEFQILPSGFLQATLIKDGKHLSLDEPGVGSTGGSDSVVLDGKELDFVPDFGRAKIEESTGKLGRGKRVEIPAHPLAPAGVSIERMLVLETYDDFPNVALVSTTYKNTGTSGIKVDQVLMQQHRLSARQVDAQAQPYDMWSFQGSSYDWGKDDVQKITRVSSQPNAMGENVKGGYGGGIPVVAFWTASVGEAIGHVETLPWTLSLPVSVDREGRVNTNLTLPVAAALNPGESYSTPRSFVAVYSGDFYEPCACGRASCRKRAGKFPSRRTKPTT
jgi:hypothetical protein